MRQVLPLLIMVCLTLSCKKDTVRPPEQPLTKSVTYRLYAAKDYSGPQYQNADVEIRLQLRRINYRTAASELVWDTTLAARKLPDLPPLSGQLTFLKSAAVMESTEKLNASASVRYNSGGSVQQSAASAEAVPGVSAIDLPVEL